MLARTAFLLLAAFWVAMNVLLWKAEYGSRQPGSGLVPIEVVWAKILTAPDHSSLDIYRDGKKIGFFRWSPNVIEELHAGTVAPETGPPEGMVKRVTGYTLDLDGNVALGDTATRLRGTVHLRLGPDRAWRELHLQFSLRPSVWEIHADAATQTVQIKVEDGVRTFTRTYAVADAQSPQQLLADLGGPWAMWLLNLVGLPATGGAALSTSLFSPGSLGLKWEARQDRTHIGHSPVRVYRLEARVLERYAIVLVVSRAGELLRLELPDDVVAINDALAL